MNAPSRWYRLPSTEFNRRELEVSGLLADGRSTNEIADTLKLSHHTVRQYIARAVEKAGVADRYQLIQWVRKQRAVEMRGVGRL